MDRAPLSELDPEALLPHDKEGSEIPKPNKDCENPFPQPLFEYPRTPMRTAWELDS